MPIYDSAVKSKVQLKDGGIVALYDTKVHIPTFYLEKNMLMVTDTVESIGVFNIIVDDKYFVLTSPLVYTLPVQSMQTITINDEPYYELNFKKGEVIIESLLVARNAILATELLLTVILRGKIPYYLTPDMVLRLVHNTSQYAGVRLDSNSAIIELVASLSQRSKSDIATFYRHNRKDGVQYATLSDVNLATFTNFSRLLNGYQSSGTITSLVNSKLAEPTKLEKILRR